jgi:hypothetical protein
MEVDGDLMPKGMKGFQKGSLNPSSTPYGRERIRQARIGQKASPETRKRLSRAIKKALRPIEMRDKWALAQTGKIKSMATRLKISASGRKRPKKIRSSLKYADSAFSKYIRIKYADENGYIHCFTCDAVDPINEMDCGHFVSRLHKSLRWDERNAHPQCRYCNRYNEGRKDVYAVRLIEKYGPDILNELQADKNRIAHVDVATLLEIAREFKAKAKELLQMKTGSPVGEPHPFMRDLPVGELS